MAFERTQRGERGEGGWVCCISQKTYTDIINTQNRKKNTEKVLGTQWCDWHKMFGSYLKTSLRLGTLVIISNWS